MSEPEIPDTFLQKAAEILHWLSGSKIVDAFLDYGERWNVSPPYSEYPLGGLTSKRQAIYENLRAFSPSQQFRIIEELCAHPSFSPSAPSKNARATLKQELHSKYGQFHLGNDAKQFNPPLISKSKYRHNRGLGEWALNGIFITLWILSRPFVWAYHFLYWFALAVAKETGNRMVQIVGGAIAIAVIAYISQFFLH